MRIIWIAGLVIACCFCVAAQESTVGSAERRVPLNEIAVALDSNSAPALEATLKTSVLHGAEDSPVTNIRMVVKNSSGASYIYVSGLVTFYDGAGVRCGEGLFKADALSVNEAFETDTPGIRIRCSPATWRIVATNLLAKVNPSVASPVSSAVNRSSMNLVISVDGEEHPIQLDKPMVLKVGNAQRTIVLREAP